MKPIITTLIVILSLVFGFGIYQNHQQKQIEKYWLKFANNAVINNDTKFLEFYEMHLYSLHTSSISEGWELYKRYCNK